MFVAVHSTITPPLSTIMVENGRKSKEVRMWVNL